MPSPVKWRLFVKKEVKQGWLGFADVSAGNIELVSKTMRNIPGIIVACFMTYLLSVAALLVFGANSQQLVAIGLK
jgi:hypothetical protein